jgi:hypothetical protein
MPSPRAKPWYRQFWPWFVLAPLIATVLGSAVTIMVAGGTPDLVVDNFSQIPLAIERDQRRDHEAARLGLQARLDLQPATNGATLARVRLTGAAPPRLSLRLVHPTSERRDSQATLEPAGDAYAGELIVPAGHRLYVELTDAAASWRLRGTLPAAQQTLQLDSSLPTASRP